MTKQFAVEQLLRQGGTIHFHKGPVPSARQKMHALADQFFAGAAFANDQAGPI